MCGSAQRALIHRGAAEGCALSVRPQPSIENTRVIKRLPF
jgi:hypothetical protein